MKDPASLAMDVLKQVARLIDKLTPEQLTDFAEGRSEIVFRSPDATIRIPGRRSPARPKAPTASVEEITDRLSAMTDTAEAEKYLDGFTVSTLRAVGAALGKGLPSKGRKVELVRRLVEDTVGFRDRHEAILGGSYRQ